MASSGTDASSSPNDEDCNLAQDDTESRCPACRMPYDKEKIVGMAANCERMVAEINSERGLKSQKAKSKASEGRKHLSSVRVIQRNLVYMIGLPNQLLQAECCNKQSKPNQLLQAECCNKQSKS